MEPSWRFTWPSNISTQGEWKRHHRIYISAEVIRSTSSIVLAPPSEMRNVPFASQTPINNIPSCVKQHSRAIKIILQLHLQIFTSIDPMLVPP